MLRYTKISLLLLVLAVSLAVSAESASSASLVINEFMASNSSSIQDPQHQYDDWIEIHNFGSSPINVGGMYLTDDLSFPTKWQIPINNPAATVITRGRYLLIWADNDTGDAGLHANFKLNADSEEIGLFDKDGQTLIDSVIYSRQMTDISYGRYPDAGEDWRLFTSPSPAAQNEGGYLGQVADTEFSHNRGFYEAPFSVTIATETDGAVIYYTLDGSEPYSSSGRAQGGMVYTAPITINRTTCLRAVAIKSGWMPSNVDTHTYIFVDDVARQPANPPGWPGDWGEEHRFKVFYITGKIPSDYEMDPRVANNTLPGYSVRDALLDIPTVSIAMLPEDFITDNENNGIYSNSYDRWERKCSVEYILPDGTDGFQEDCKIEVHGNASRYFQRMHKHSLRLTFTSEYGPAKLKYPLFPESPVDEFNQLILRASFTDSWGLVSWDPGRYRPNDSQYIRDVWMKESLRDMGQPSSYGNFVHLYVDGLYFGLHNLTDRLADDFFADHLGGEPEDWEINEDLSSPDARWNTMMNINPVTPDGYSRIQDYLNVENFADYMLLHFYADPEDWPHHNGYAAVNAVSGDGRYRFFVWDQELVLDKHNLAASRINRTGGAGTVFQSMRTSDEFRLLFADRFYKHCFNEGALSVTASQNRYLNIADMIDKAIVAESARWGDTQMSTPYGNAIQQPNPPTDINHDMYPPAPHAPDYYFTREDSWIVERDNVINNYIPAIHDTANYYALINILRAANLYPGIDPPIFHVNNFYQHGGQITPDDLISMTSNKGVIFYTLDGTDPRLAKQSTASISTTTLVAENAHKRVLVPVAAVSDDWKSTIGFNDTAWMQSIGSPGGIGYERSSGYGQFISLDLANEMYGRNATCYIRTVFVFTGSNDEFNFMTLKIRYDDAFIAYLNGVEVARRNFNGTPAWNSRASTSHSDSAAVLLESIDISAFLDNLQQGPNLLAIHGLNASTTSSDLLISAELIAGKDDSSGTEGISPTAIEYTGPITINHSASVKARVLSGNTWSALNEAVYAVGPVAENLRITEIMYNPPDPNEEFIELQNIGAETINLNLVSFTNGIDFTFPGIELAPGEYTVAVQNRNIFEARYGTAINIAGQYSGKLNNAGERIELEDAIGRTILNFRYEDGWRSLTDGKDFSLTIIDSTNPELSSWGEKDSWRPSAYPGGSPGQDDSSIIPNPGAVVINEVLAHSHAEASDWIELYNTTGTAIDIGGWFLSDSNDNPAKYEIANGTTIGPNGYLVLYEDLNFGNTNDSGAYESFALSENGERLYLSSAQNDVLTGYRNVEDFGASETGVSFGRYYKSSTGNYNFVAMSENTPGSANAYPKVGPIVISEIMYNPNWPDGGSYTNDQYEYIELHNISAEPVTLYNYVTGEPWKFTDGIEFTFPADSPVTIPAGGVLLVVNHPAAFSWRYPSVSAGIIFGPYDGNLSNAGESLELSMPGDVDKENVRQYIRIDRVNYSDGSHPENCPGGADLWPVEADGAGMALTRKVPNDYGNDPDNWLASATSPGE